jgi:hypothetical protein
MSILPLFRYYCLWCKERQDLEDDYVIYVTFVAHGWLFFAALGLFALTVIPVLTFLLTVQVAIRCIGRYCLLYTAYTRSITGGKVDLIRSCYSAVLLLASWLFWGVKFGGGKGWAASAFDCSYFGGVVWWFRWV